MAVGRLIRLANSEFNADKAYAKISVVSDFEHRCFNINFETVIGLLDQIKTMLGVFGEDIKSAKDILTQVGFIGGGAGFSLYGYLKFRKGRKVKSADIVEEGRGGRVSIKFEGDHSHSPVIINQHIYNLSRSTPVLKAVRDSFAPIGVDGFERMNVTEDGGEGLAIDPPDAQSILASCNAGIEETEESEPDIQQTTAWLKIYSPVFDVHASAWRFKMDRETIVADITETKIAEQAMARGGAMVDDAYEVRIEIKTPKNAKGKKGRPTYKILRVNKFVPGSPSMQASLFENGAASNPSTDGLPDAPMRR